MWSPVRRKSFGALPDQRGDSPLLGPITFGETLPCWHCTDSASLRELVAALCKAEISAGSTKHRTAGLFTPKKRVVIECDELWSFVGKKARKQWIWIAMDCESRLVVAMHICSRGLRSKRTLAKFARILPRASFVL